MIGDTLDGKKRDAFLLFEGGNYSESYEICRTITAGEDDASIMILTAMNLFHMGKLDEAEAFFKDLVCRLPESSYIHSYLGRMLEMKGDEQAMTHYARAVVLDPKNQEALRSYATYLLSSGDPRYAAAVLQHLCTISERDEDFQTLIRALLATNEPGNALELYEERKGRGISDVEYIKILFSCNELERVLEIAERSMEKSTDPLLSRCWLLALSKTDPETAISSYPSIIKETGDQEIALDYILLLKKQGRIREAIETCSTLVEENTRDNPGFSLVSAELYARAGDREEACERYRRLIKSLLALLGDPGLLAKALSSFRTFLFTYYPRKVAVSAFLDTISGQPDVVCLIEAARLYEEIGDLTEARSWYYRAYRSDYYRGGCEYARFLAAVKDFRECEKVMLYVVNNVRKTSDLTRIAGLILGDVRLYRLKRLLDRLIQRLELRIPVLNSYGQEYLALSLLYAASNALGENDFPGCKEACLRGLDIVPPHSRDIRPVDFLKLLEACKEKTVCDIPLYHGAGTEKTAKEMPSETLQAILELDEKERKIVDFLRAHGRANEMDLRTLLGTRRAAGYVNRVLQKSASKGVSIIEKKGVGQFGEIYEYCGA